MMWASSGELLRRNWGELEALTESRLDAPHDVFQVRFGDRVINGASFFHAGQKATPLHQSQMIGGRGLRQIAFGGNFVDRISFPGQQHLHDLKSMWVSQRFKALGRFGKRLEVQRLVSVAVHGQALSAGDGGGEGSSRLVLGEWGRLR